MATGSRKGRRTHAELHSRILECLAGSQQTTNQIAIRSGINWRTVELHLTYLCGRSMVQEVLNSPYVRIFAISDKGREALAQHRSKLQVKKSDEAVFSVNPKK